MHITSVDIYRTGCRVGVVPLSPGVYSRYACGLYLYSYILYIGNSPSAMQTLLKRTPEKFKISFLFNFLILLTITGIPKINQQATGTQRTLNIFKQTY